MANVGDRPKKLQRISQACDLCHRRSIRCRPSIENAVHQCQNCYDFAVECTYQRPSRRRRNQATNPQGHPPNVLPSQQQQHYASLRSPRVKAEQGQSSRTASLRQPSGSPDVTGAYMTVREGRDEDPLDVAWRAYVSINGQKIQMYMEAFMNFVYPIFPLFHGPTLWDRLHASHHLTDRGFFASVMAACSLAAARARDGALPDFPNYHHEENSDVNSEIFFSAAQAAVAKDLSKANSFGVLRACGLLALTSIQYGQIPTMHQYIGYYHTLSAMMQFHDEDNWPPGLTVPAREERRRLFWSMYQLDVYIACVFQSMPRSQEKFANVSYPLEVTDDDLLTMSAPSATAGTTWLRGFNFTIDLYRVLAYTLDRMRMNQGRRDRAPVHRMFVGDGQSTVQILENVVSFYFQQPADFRKFDLPVTGNRNEDILGFQIANIQATLQLVRMTLIESDPKFDGHQKCNIVDHVLNTFNEIDAHYLKAISTPLVYHLGRIGHILASVIQGPLTEELYKRVRAQLDSLADLLEGLESGLQPTAGASKELREQVEKIDRHMQDQERGLLRMAQMQQPQTIASASSGNVPQSISHNMPPLQMPYRPTHTLSSNASAPGAMDEFQLPQELTGEWPWPFEVQGEPGYHVLPGFNNQEEQRE